MNPSSSTPINLPPVNTEGNSAPSDQAVLANKPMTSGIKENSDSAQSQQTVAAPPIADDVDLIEKEWVEKVKEIIGKTKGDPYEQSRQLSIIKSEYLQKRYNRAVKLS